MALTASKSTSSQMAVMVETSVRMPGHPPLTMSIIPKTGLATTTWVTDLLGLAAGHMVSVHYLREFDM